MAKAKGNAVLNEVIEVLEDWYYDTPVAKTAALKRKEWTAYQRQLAIAKQLYGNVSLAKAIEKEHGVADMATQVCNVAGGAVAYLQVTP